MENSNNSRIKGFLVGLAAGSAVGSIIALLYAPKSGRELRHDINVKKDQVLHDAGEKLTVAKQKAYGLYEDSIHKAGNLVDEAKRRIGNFRKGTEEAVSTGKEYITAENERLKDAVKSGIEAYKEERKTSARKQQ
jgi:gas vesicle protein